MRQGEQGEYNKREQRRYPGLTGRELDQGEREGGFKGEERRQAGREGITRRIRSYTGSKLD